MKQSVKIFISTLLILCAISFNSQVFGFASGVHEKAIDQAFDYLRTGDAKSRWVYGFYEYHASRNGTSTSAAISKKGPSPDNFLDTVIGAWWIGYRYFVEVQFLTNIGFTSYWHFSSPFRPGKNGDRYSGFAYPIAPSEGFFGLNNIIKTVLYNQEIKSGSYENARGLVLGVKDIFQIVTEDWLGLLSDFYNGEKDGGWGIPGAPDSIHDYQTQTSSTDHNKNGQYENGSWRIPSSNWDDIQDTYFNPGANAGQYWYNQFTHNSSFDDIKEAQLNQLGYMMHWVVDGSAVVHTWSSTGNNHTGFESFADELISSGWKPDSDRVAEVIQKFKNSDMTTYAQKMKANTLASSGCVTPTVDVTKIADDGVPIKCLKIGGKTDPTLYSVGDILRWLAIEANQNTKVLTDDSEETFRKAAEANITLAVAGVTLVLEKSAADLYKFKQFSRMVNAGTAPSEGVWGYSTFTIGGSATFNQIR